MHGLVLLFLLVVEVPLTVGELLDLPLTHVTEQVLGEDLGIDRPLVHAFEELDRELSGDSAHSASFAGLVYHRTGDPHGINASGPPDLGHSLPSS